MRRTRVPYYHEEEEEEHVVWTYSGKSKNIADLGFNEYHSDVDDGACYSSSDDDYDYGRSDYEHFRYSANANRGVGRARSSRSGSRRPTSPEHTTRTHQPKSRRRGRGKKPPTPAYKETSSRIEVGEANPLELFFNTGILWASDGTIPVQAKIFFHKKNLFVDKVKVKNFKIPLEQVLNDRQYEPWSCVVRVFPAKRNGKTTAIRGFEVQYIADVVWIGERPFPPPGATSEGRAEGVAGNEEPREGSRKNTRTKIVYAGNVVCCSSSKGVLEKHDGLDATFEAKQCFFYGLSLEGIRLDEVLRIDTPVTYELSSDRQNVDYVYLGTPDLEESEQYRLISNYCALKRVPQATTKTLLCMTGYLTPTIDRWDVREIVDADD